MSRVALVTGGTRGIGAAISKALHGAGYRVAAEYTAMVDAAAKFKAETEIPVYRRDVVSGYEACAAGVARVASDIGPIEVLVNNAGITRDAFPAQNDNRPMVCRDQYQSKFEFNMFSPVIDGMRERNFGRIVTISSINGQKGQMGQVNYSAAKAGEVGFTKALAQESANKGITVNTVCPGYIATEMVMAVAPEVIAKRILPHIPAGRLGEPEEVARCVLFLAADEAGFITGSTLTANGGQYMV